MTTRLNITFRDLQFPNMIARGVLIVGRTETDDRVCEFESLEWEEVKVSDAERAALDPYATRISITDQPDRERVGAGRRLRNVIHRTLDATETLGQRIGFAVVLAVALVPVAALAGVPAPLLAFPLISREARRRDRFGWVERVKTCGTCNNREVWLDRVIRPVLLWRRAVAVLRRLWARRRPTGRPNAVDGEPDPGTMGPVDGHHGPPAGRTPRPAVDPGAGPESEKKHESARISPSLWPTIE